MRTAGQQSRDVPGSHTYLFKVVEDEQEPALAQIVDEQIERRPSAVFLQVERACDGWQDEIRIAHRGQKNESSAIGKFRRCLLGNTNGQTRLADPTGSGHGEETRAAIEEERQRRSEVGLTADQRRQGLG